MFVLNECEPLKKNFFIKGIPNKSELTTVFKGIKDKGIPEGNLFFYNKPITGLNFSRMCILFLNESVFSNIVEEADALSRIETIRDKLSENVRRIVQYEALRLVIT